MAEGVSDNAADGAIQENISGTQSFEIASPEVDPMQKIEQHPRPDNIPEKFWDAVKGEVRTDALLKSYTELETKIGSGSSSAEGESAGEGEGEGQAEGEAEGASEGAEGEAEGEGEGQAEGEAEGEKEGEGEGEAQVSLADAITAAQTYMAENGDLPADARADLHKLGITDEVIDLQIAGAKAYTAAIQKAAEEAAGVPYAEVEKAIAWAAENWSEKRILAFNAQGGDVETVGLAVAGLMKDYLKANPGEGKLMNINSPANRGDVFGHNDEFAAALKAADEIADPAARRVARRAAIAKMDRSLKAGTVVRKK